MFKVGEFVIHKTEGVCIIDEITVKNYGDGDIEYYIMHRYFDTKKGSCVMIPVANAPQLRKCIKKEEAKRLIRDFPKSENIWVKDYKKRREIFSNIIASGDLDQICNILKSIYDARIEYRKNKKAISLTDSQICSFIERIIFEEIALALDMHPDEVDKMIEAAYVY